MKGATILLPPANEVCEGYVFTFCSQGGLQAHTQRGCWGVWWEVSRPTPRGDVGGSGDGVSRRTPRGRLGVWPGGSPGPTPRGRLGGLAEGVCRPTPWGVRGRGWISACTEADLPADGYCCGRYASYWNAFLYYMVLPYSPYKFK